MSLNSTTTHQAGGPPLAARGARLMTRLAQAGRLVRGLACVLAFSLAPGCGYTLRAPYDQDITTVYVPVFRSFTFRPEQNLELTRMVQQEIIKRTPFKVVDTPEEADTVLAGTILFTSKNVWVTTPQNFPRNVTAELTAEVTWEDVRPTADPTEEPPKVRVVRYVYFYPEIGETAQLGFTRAMQQIAADIVNMMEQPW